MPLIRPSKLPPVPELGEKTFWDYFPRRALRRIVFLLIALGAVIFLKSSGRWSFGGLFGPATPVPAGPVYHIKVTRPEAPAPESSGPKSTP
jgi:hypothetical protein